MASLPETEQKTSRLTGTLEVVQWCADNGLGQVAYIVGRWVWVQFAEKPDSETRAKLKGAGFRWVKRRGAWAHNCGVPSKRGTGCPFWKYGKVRVADALESEAA